MFKSIVSISGRIVSSQLFQNIIISIIIFGSLLVGIESYQSINQKYSEIIKILDQIVIIIFIIEIILKILANGRKPYLYFYDSWNIFDFLIVVICFLPFGNTIIALRLLRILRVFRLFSALPKLKVLIMALVKSLPSIGYVSILLLILFYTYGVNGVYIFGSNDPQHFGNLNYSMLTLFEVITLEGWVDVLKFNMLGCENYHIEGIQCIESKAYPIIAPIYFITFILIGTMIILNLFVGIIINNMSEASKEVILDRNKGQNNNDLIKILMEVQNNIQKIKDQIKETK